MQNKKICIIGGGISGIACLKELKSQGIAADLYEMMPIPGGVFASYSWKNGMFTSSTVFTWFSDFPVENRQAFFSWEAFLDYLDDYIDHFDLSASITLNTRVTSCIRDGDKWLLGFHEKNWSNGHYFHPQQQLDESIYTKQYDILIVCAGLHHAAAMPNIETLSEFKGEVIHSQSYRDANDFENKDVLVVGAGESGSDIATQISAVASSCTISMRSAPGTLFPKDIQGNTPDIRDDRLLYNLPRKWWRLILRGHKKFYLSQQKDKALFQWAAKSNYDNNRCPFNTNACKSFGIPEALINYNADIKPEISSMSGNTVKFTDGSEKDFDAVVFCTGYKAAFPFFNDELSNKVLPINTLWKSMVLPEYRDSLFFAGFSRPNQINLITVSEMQARTIALIIKGEKVLPANDKLAEVISYDQGWMNKYYKERYEKNPALVDFLFYVESLAKFIGCQPPVLKVLIKDPCLWFKLIYAALNGAHYRLVGPGANWDLAASTIKKTPVFKNKKNAIRRWLATSMLALISMVISLFNRDYKKVTWQSKF